MTPVITLPKVDPDAVCSECGRPAIMLFGEGLDEHGDISPVGRCADHLPGDENLTPKHMTPVAFAGVSGRG